MFLRKLRHLRSAWNLVRGFRFAEASEWTALDEQALRQFLQTNTGRKFGWNLRATAFNAAVGLTNGGNDLPHKSGYAAGIMATAAHIDALANWGKREAAISDERPADDLAWMTDTQTQNTQ